MKKILLVVLTLFLSVSYASAKTLKALLVSGQNNHNWKVSHVVLDKILENSGMFDVDVMLTPATGGDMNSFNPEFSKYDVVVLDYNGDSWNKATQDAFIEYVKKGGGVVIYHAANNAFTEWEEFNKIIALGGWGGRTEKDGPYVYLKDGKLFYDTQKGNGGSHGPQVKFNMNKLAGVSHPITKGLPDTWMHATDELYCSMRGPGNIKDVLFWAKSKKEEGGSGRDELLIFTVDYHKGRIFHTMLGHAGETVENSPAMQCAGFQITLLRGAEWAATGKVKQPVPADFPKDQVVYRKDYK